VDREPVLLRNMDDLTRVIRTSEIPSNEDPTAHFAKVRVLLRGNKRVPLMVFDRGVGYRVSRDGPAFHGFGNQVRYCRPDLDAWAAKRRATTTAEADRLRAA